MPEREEIRIKLRSQSGQNPACPDCEQEFWLDMMEKRIMEALRQSSDEEMTLHILREQIRYLEC